MLRSPGRSATRRSISSIPTRAPDGWRAAAEAREQAVTPVIDDDAPVAVLVHDRALCSDEELLEAVGSTVRAARAATSA